MHSLCGMSTNFYITCFSITEFKKIHIFLASSVDGKRKTLPNPLTSSLLLAGVESLVGLVGPDPPMKAQEHFILHTYKN